LRSDRIDTKHSCRNRYSFRIPRTAATATVAVGAIAQLTAHDPDRELALQHLHGVFGVFIRLTPADGDPVQRLAGTAPPDRFSVMTKRRPLPW